MLSDQEVGPSDQENVCLLAGTLSIAAFGFPLTPVFETKSGDEHRHDLRAVPLYLRGRRKRLQGHPRGRNAQPQGR